MNDVFEDDLSRLMRDEGLDFPDAVNELARRRCAARDDPAGLQNPSNYSVRGPCCSVGYGGDDGGIGMPWVITWLPKGYGPSLCQFDVCRIAEPPGEDWSGYGLGTGKRPPLIEAICATIEALTRAKL